MVELKEIENKDEGRVWLVTPHIKIIYLLNQTIHSRNPSLPSTGISTVPRRIDLCVGGNNHAPF